MLALLHLENGDVANSFLTLLDHFCVNALRISKAHTLTRVRTARARENGQRTVARRYAVMCSVSALIALQLTVRHCLLSIEIHRAPVSDLGLKNRGFFALVFTSKSKRCRKAKAQFLTLIFYRFLTASRSSTAVFCIVFVAK